jgi:single-strand DNA-binding protein
MHTKLIIIGNLGRDPEMRFTPDGTPVTTFPVATNQRWTDAAGQQREQVTWFRVSAWRRLAETCSQYLSKGRQVYVEGELKPDENGGPRVWTGNDGVARAQYEVTARVVKFLGGRGDAPAQPTFDTPLSQAAPTDEGIPF